MASNEAAVHISVDDLAAAHLRLQEAIVVLANRMNSLEDSLRRHTEWLAAMDVRISQLRPVEAVKPNPPPDAAVASPAHPGIPPFRLPKPIPPPPKFKRKPEGGRNG